MSAPAFNACESMKQPGEFHYAKSGDMTSLCDELCHRHGGVSDPVTCPECVAHKELIEACFECYGGAAS